MGGQQYISRFEIAEDDRRLARLQGAKHGAELHADIEHLLNRQVSSPGCTPVFLEGLAFDEIHHQIPVSKLTKIVIDPRDIGMLRSSDQIRLPFEALGALD